LSINHFVQGNYDLTLAEVDKMSALNPCIFHQLHRQGRCLQGQGDFLAAEKEYQKLFDLDEEVAHLYGRYMLAPLYLMEGKYKETEKQINLGIELAEKLGDKVWQLNFLMALDYINDASGHPKKPWKHAARLGRCLRNRKLIREKSEFAGKRNRLFGHEFAR